MDIRPSIWEVVLATAATWMILVSPTRACDDFASRMISSALASGIEGLECAGVNAVGLDHPDHHLQSVCYTSEGATSRLKIVASLQCKTSDRAFLSASISDTVTAEAKVHGTDCQLIDVEVKSSGELSKLLIQGLGINGIARKKLQEALNKLCS